MSKKLTTRQKAERAWKRRLNQHLHFNTPLQIAGDVFAYDEIVPWRKVLEILKKVEKEEGDEGK
jgi:hypothetical protein